MQDKNLIIDNTFLICVLSLILAVFELFNYEYAFDPNLFYACSLALNCAILFNVTQVMFTLTRISGRWPQMIGMLYTIVALTIGISVAGDLKMGGFEEALVTLGIIIHSMMFSIVLAIGTLTYFVHSLRMSPHDFKQSLEKRFKPNDDNRQFLLTFYAILGISLFTAITSVMVLLYEFDSAVFSVQADPHYPMSQLHLAWLPLTLLAISILRQENEKSLQSLSLTSLVSEQAKKFMIRYHADRKNWSTTVGMRTANFMVDHDPNEDAKSILPSYMVRIRQNQIHTIVRDILNDRMIDDRVVSNQIYGAIDPENSIRACTDVLLMFTAIYIDGIPMIESRLKNLVRLLPILDPDLAQKITVATIEKNFGKIQWFFHLDFDWIDQHMTTSAYRTDYEVNVDNLRLRDRQKVLSVLEKHNLMGNFIWVGEKARERIILEAPYLANIIEAWPINLAKDEYDNSGESVIFLIKFEQLIPRMQKYYNLEEIRKKLRYYDPSLESRRMINIIDLEIQQSLGTKNLLDIISLVNNYPWSGFKEKDLALDLVLKAFEKHQATLSEESEKTSQKVIKEFVKTVKNIGYPSQEIHAAHQEKMRIRESSVICETLLNTNHERFNEAWLLIATTPAKNYKHEEIISLLEGINQAALLRTHRKIPIVTNKITESFFNIAQELTDQDIEPITTTCNSIARFLVESEASPDVFCFFIDAKIFLEGNLKTDIILEREVLDQMQAYFSRMYDKHGSESSTVLSLSMRWRILMNQASSVHTAS